MFSVLCLTLLRDPICLLFADSLATVSSDHLQKSLPHTPLEQQHQATGNLQQGFCVPSDFVQFFLNVATGSHRQALQAYSIINVSYEKCISCLNKNEGGLYGFKGEKVNQRSLLSCSEAKLPEDAAKVSHELIYHSSSVSLVSIARYFTAWHSHCLKSLSVQMKVTAKESWLLISPSDFILHKAISDRLLLLCSYFHFLYF
ncbi:hypothetical protein BCR41DRAFT_405285 [Lobosporangium transversale]|uniref:Uncharacterized protein n=1 Tax=Lobosporangium transversale TaxID=64571 RepID=A0A1Y2GPA3_9FUNG|nr:hypothetical protein BCR41DRAFT_405285 [Lobosporangium transversale]ORZ17519.1 hypothetical protein BCR41DRAFT_405285 [Lobosporangium transversale]|eukprot:XP_021881906.1 hypothetical protein BCR41DRAFT_405285 [Lobosporangium transversale]